MSPARQTILVVEDEFSIALLFRSTLEAEGYAVELVDTGQASLDRLAQGGVDLVLLDQHLPDFLGTDVLKELQARGAHPPVVIVTARGDVELAVEALKAGAMDYLVKDVELAFLAQLPRTVIGALERASLEQRNHALVQELRRHEERVRGIFARSPIGIGLLDGRGRLVSANEACAKLFGLGHPSELEGFRLIDALQLEPARQALQHGEALEAVTKLDFESLGARRLPRMRDRGHAHLELLLTPLAADGADGAVRAMVQLQDVTPRMHTERALREREELLRTLYEHAPVLISALDPDGRVLLWNRHMELTLGWQRDEVVGSTTVLEQMYRDPAELERVRASIARAEGHFEEFTVHTRDGGQRVQHWATFQVPGGDGTVMAVGHDLTSNRATEDALQHARVQLSNLEEVLGVLTRCKLLQQDGERWEKLQAQLRQAGIATVTQPSCGECMLALEPSEASEPEAGV